MKITSQTSTGFTEIKRICVFLKCFYLTHLGAEIRVCMTNWSAQEKYVGFLDFEKIELKGA